MQTVKIYQLNHLSHKQFQRLKAAQMEAARVWKKLQRARNKQCRRAERRIRDLRHKATRQVIDFCVEQKVGILFIGNPHGVREKNSGRHHNQRMSLWESGSGI